MARFNEERAPLELTNFGKDLTEVVGCPYCKSGRKVSKTWYSGVCSRCGRYFRKSEAITDESQLTMINQSKPIDEGFTKLKAKAEKQAYEWRDEQIAKQKAGMKKRTHDAKEIEEIKNKKGV